VLRLFALQAERARAAAGGAPVPAVAPGGDDGAAPAPVAKHCGAGSAGIAIDPYGNVYPCVQWRRPAGNLHRQPIAEIWQGSAALAEVRRLTVEAKQVVDAHGPDGALLSFCPGTAAALAGDPLAVYPSALRRMEVAREARDAASGGKRVLLPIV
jgi:radical SAM protein with 4Fe4S-binding SPASM domain